MLYLQRDQWGTRLQKSYDASVQISDTEDLALTKDTTSTIDSMKVLADERKITLVISTGSIDRDNDTIDPKGWDIKNYQKNPIVLFGHRMGELPIAVATKITKEPDKLSATDQFPEREVSAFADTVYQFLTHNPPLLRTASVGFRSKAHQFNDERGGFDFLKQELLEHSIVPIPSNTDAFVQARSVLADDIFAPWKQWAEEMLDIVHGEGGIWLPRSKVETALLAITPKQHVVPDAGPIPVEAELVDLTVVPETDNEPHLVNADQVRAIVATLLDERSIPILRPVEQPEVFDVNTLFMEDEPIDEALQPESLKEIGEQVLRESVAEAFRESLTALTGRLD